LKVWSAFITASPDASVGPSMVHHDTLGSRVSENRSPHSNSSSVASTRTAGRTIVTETSCCWIGRGGNSARTSAARFRITWPRSWSGWGSIDRTGWKPCAASVDYSSRRRADRAHSSMPRHAARGTGSRARRPLEPPLCRPLARHRALNRHLHDAFTRRARPACALTSLPGAVPTGQDEPFYVSRQVTTPIRWSS
jgi:hypothetical protein